ncbi:MAG: urease accessory protein UreF [Rikenellaceae bacterium]
MRLDLLTTLLHLSDPTLPIGGYAHSCGLESYVQRGVVCDEATAKEFIRNSLHYNAKFNDAIYLRLAWESGADITALRRLDEECRATKSPREIRQASEKLGVRLLKIFSRKISLKDLSGVSNYAVIYGAVAYRMGLSLEDTLLSFYYNTMVCMVTNAVKLIPLGQLAGQDILFELEQELEQLTQETVALDREMRGVCAVGFDIGAMQHERLYSRLYMS